MAAATMEKRRSVTVAPWGIEADHPRNGDLKLKGLIGIRLRSKIKPVKDVFTRNRKTGEQELKSVPAKVIADMPSNIPGMQLHVDPANGTWKVFDPLSKDERTCEQIKAAMDAQTGVQVENALRGMPTKDGHINRDQMKTLVREMLCLVEAGEAVVAKGMKPDLEDVDGLPGDYLRDPTGLDKYRMPKFEKDMEEWEHGLDRVG